MIKGRKRHIVVDTMGYLIVVLVHAANIHDGRAAREVLAALFSVVDTIKKFGQIALINPQFAHFFERFKISMTYIGTKCFMAENHRKFLLRFKIL
ncbi:MAG: hypothetical protein MZV65_15205 [Chromatiales bacterium]|nr:hypothetical protein [Chromatiales bacterium]